MEILKQKKQMTIFAIIALMAFTFFMFGYLPLRKKLSNVKQTLSKQKLAVMKAQIEKQHIPQVQILLSDLQGRISDFDSKIPDNRDLGNFLQQATKLMNDYGLKEQQIQPDAEIKAAAVSCIPIDMQCKGTLQQLFGFYDALRNSDRLIRIKKVGLNNDDGYSGNLTMKAKAVIYYLN